jgi:hypothetical protein
VYARRRADPVPAADPEHPGDSELWTEPRVLLTGPSAGLSPRWGQAWTQVLAVNLRAARDGSGWTNLVTGSGTDD